MPTRFELLGRPHCLEEKGRVEASFETAWGTLGSNPDITQLGDLNLNLVWDQEPMSFIRQGVAAGIGQDGKPSIVMVGVMGGREQSLFVPLIHLDPRQMVVGTPMDLDLRGPLRGTLLYRGAATGGRFTPAGFMVNGQLTFDAFEAREGAPVRGRLSSAVMGWAPQ